MSRSFNINNVSYKEEDMTVEQKKMFNEILNSQNDIASIIRQHRSYEAYCRIMTQQLTQSLTSENSAEESSEK
mgnify:CR=1 FL=1|jgi:hypothetical protein